MDLLCTPYRSTKSIYNCYSRPSFGDWGATLIGRQIIIDGSLGPDSFVIGVTVSTKVLHLTRRRWFFPVSIILCIHLLAPSVITAPNLISVTASIFEF